MHKPVVLFLCTGNSARSQMAEALLRKEAGDCFEACSAGTEPKGINPLTVQVMKELDIDISKQRSKHLREYLGFLPVRILVVVCAEAEKSCPTVWPGALQRLYWRFDDPAASHGTDEDKLNKFREIRDAIHRRIKDWLAEMRTEAVSR